jgi:hypothetical protein
MELDRMRYAISKYLRTRLLKIEKDVFYILGQTKDMLATGRLCERLVPLYCSQNILKCYLILALAD